MKPIFVGGVIMDGLIQKKRDYFPYRETHSLIKLIVAVKYTVVAKCICTALYLLWNLRINQLNLVIVNLNTIIVNSYNNFI